MGADGSDFLAFWSAAQLVRSGAAELIYDPAALLAVQATVGRQDVFAFVNPPPLLLGIWPLGYLDYPIAWVVWVAATYGLWVLATRRLYPALAWPIAAFPGALVAAWHAQTGFLTSAWQSAAAKWLGEKPFRAGLCVGALIVKPHLAVLIPVALLAGRQWRAIAGAAASVVGLLAISWFVFGTATMLAYPRAWSVSEYLLRTGDATFFLRQTTIYAMARVAFSAGAAAVLQGIASALMVALIWTAWSKQGSLEGKLALLFAATPLATPYLFSYDLPFLVIPICWLAQRWRQQDLGNWSRPILLGLYLAPLLTRAFTLPLGINLMPAVSIAMVWLVWRGIAADVRPAPAAGT